MRDPFRSLRCLTPLLLAILLLGACSKAQDGGQARPPEAIPVVLGEVERRAVALRADGIGNAEAINTVAIKSRVDGQIVAVRVADGAAVAKGEVLFDIDGRGFAAQLRQAEANLARDQAQLARASQQDERNRDLLARHFISPDAYAQIKAGLDSAAAVVAADRAAIDSARLQLDYATIRAPIAGRIGKIMITAGNLVKANDTAALAVINQMSPIYVSFAVPEQALAGVRAAMARVRLAVDVSYALADGSPRHAAGQLAFVDNSVDATTGTIRLRAQLDNRDGGLWPGQFVHAAVRLGEQADAIVIASRAVQTGPRGPYVFVIDAAKNTAALREIQVDRGDGPITVVAAGLTPGEKVVVDGQSRLVPGAAVTAMSEGR